jgi:hypothetical protein
LAPAAPALEAPSAPLSTGVFAGGGAFTGFGPQAEIVSERAIRIAGRILLIVCSPLRPVRRARGISALF